MLLVLKRYDVTDFTFKYIFAYAKYACIQKEFSLPVKFGLNPEPNSSKFGNLAVHLTLPSVALRTPQIILSKVVFPAPLSPIIPITSLNKKRLYP